MSAALTADARRPVAWIEATPEPEPIEDVVAGLVERAVKTLFALPDRERALLAQPVNSWPEVIRLARDAYGYTPPRVRRFRPTPRDVEVMLPVWAWLAWLKQADADDYRLVLAVALETPWHVIAGRNAVSERTVRRRHDQIIHRLSTRFGDEALRLA